MVKYRSMLISYKELHRDVRYHLKYSRYLVYINALIVVAVEAARQRVTVGGDTVSGLMLTDDFVGYQKHPKDCRN